MVSGVGPHLQLGTIQNAVSDSLLLTAFFLFCGINSNHGENRSDHPGFSDRCDSVVMEAESHYAAEDRAARLFFARELL